jgi:hypothetical protein
MNSFYLFKKKKEKMDQPLIMEELDSSNGVLFPFYDEDTNMIFLCGKVKIFFYFFVAKIDVNVSF